MQCTDEPSGNDGGHVRLADTAQTLLAVREVATRQPVGLRTLQCCIRRGRCKASHGPTPVVGRMLLQLRRVQRCGQRLLRLGNGMQGGATNDVDAAQREARVLAVQVCAGPEDQVALSIRATLQ